MAEAKKTAKKADKTEKEVKEAVLKAETVVEGKAPEAKLETEVLEEKAATAKAGKRSAKSLKEAEEKQAKAERKETSVEEKPKAPVKPPRSRAERAGKKYREAAKLVEAGKEYSLAEALDLVTKTSPTKFDGTVEMHINLGVDPKQADQNIRGTLSLPAGTGKTIRIAVFAEADDAAKAKKAGADIAGEAEITGELDKENINFDVLIATPKMMPTLGKYARLLGPRGLMPNPKSGTVTDNVANAVAEAKAGKVEYRVDPAGIVHLGIGKVSFGPVKLAENAEVVLGSIRQAKPASVKGIYLKSITISSTMGPGIRVKG